MCAHYYNRILIDKDDSNSICQPNKNLASIKEQYILTDIKLLLQNVGDNSARFAGFISIDIN